MSYPITERIPGVPVSLGESISVPVGSLNKLRCHNRRSTSEGMRGTASKSRLPPAVANVPADHIRGYVHSKRVNNYLVGNTLGEGSFAKVKEAFHILVGEKVAMKVIDKKKAQQDPYVAKNFRREARLLQMVRHPNILHLMEVIETDTSFYLITELCSGGELMKHIYSKGRLDEAETRKYMRQIVSAVDHLHRAGIIHRDLKVENMLLDGNMDIKIIDFGLSNEEFIQGDHGMIHCSTQCGSPAYAAPELLGHKEYGPEVDIWSIGVNMYAMLTGCLPYTVEPFNITALHAKMLENKMNPIPESLSSECKSLLRQLLEANPERRIKMDAIMSHTWLNEGHTLPFGPAPYPNSLTPNDINTDIIDHMIHVLKVDQTKDDLIQELLTNKATSSACTYFLLSARLDRYQRKYPKKRVRHKSTRISQDHGYFEDEGDDDDIKSIKSVPTNRTRASRQGTRPSHVPLREKRGREGVGADRATSHPPFDNQPDLESPTDMGELKFGFHRRKSLPPTILENPVKQVQEKKLKKTNTWTHRSPHGTKPPGFTDYKSPEVSIEEHDPPYELDYHEPLGPVFPSSRGGSLPRNHSHGQQLNQLRKDLKEKLHPSVQNAWRSNPGSCNPSRHGSRIPSSTSTRTNSIQSGMENLQDDEEETPIVFHQARAQTLPRNFALRRLISQDSDDGTHLPSLSTPHHPPPTRTGGRPDVTSHRPNGLRTSSGDKYQVKTDLSVDEILTEILRVAGNLKMRESELQGHTLSCHWRGVRFKLTVQKDRFDLCHFIFKLNSGELSKYHDLCERFMKKLNLE